MQIFFRNQRNISYRNIYWKKYVLYSFNSMIVIWYLFWKINLKSCNDFWYLLDSLLLFSLLLCFFKSLFSSLGIGAFSFFKLFFFQSDLALIELLSLIEELQDCLFCLRSDEELLEVSFGSLKQHRSILDLKRILFIFNIFCHYNASCLNDSRRLYDWKPL